MEYKFTDENFQSEVLESDIPVLVDFYADWCGPCKMLAPVIEEIAKEYEGVVKVGKLDVDAQPNISSKYKIMTIPTLLFFKNGEKVEQMVGLVAKSKITDTLDSLK